MMQHYKEMCIVLHQDFAKFKNQMIFKVILLFLFSLITLLFVHFLLGILFFLFTIPVIFQHFYALEKKYQRYINAKEIAFYNLYRFLVNMLANKIIVYNALKECLPYIDEVLYADVQQWIENIEQDSSLQPFIEFSNHFSQALIKQMILMPC